MEVEMCKKSFFILPLLVILLSISFSDLLYAQSDYESTPPEFYRRNLGGPRLGVTFLPGNSDLVKELKENNMDPVLSQFGWHFEWQVAPKGGGPAFVIEAVPLFAGVEYGKFIPSATLAMGIRMPNGIEFGMGPNLIATGKTEVKSSLVLAIGKTINYSGVSLPLNLVFATNPGGKRISFIFGYAIAK